MALFIGTLTNRKSRVVQNVVSMRTIPNEYASWYNGTVVEGDSVAHDYAVSEYEFKAAPKIFQEQFAELPVGARFRIKSDLGSIATGVRMKLDATHYILPQDSVDITSVSPTCGIEVVE